MKKVLAIITAALMVMTVIPSVAFAEESTDVPTPVSVNEEEPDVEAAAETNDVTAKEEESDLNVEPEGTLDAKEVEETPESPWYTDESGDKYYYVNGYYPDGELKKDDWFEYEGNRYYAGADGVIYKGKKDVNGDTYYFAPDSGILQKNYWFNEAGKDFYFGSEGSLMKNSWVDGNKYYVGADGTKVKNSWVDGNKYYVGADGTKVKNSWVDGNKYYVKADGIKATGIVKIGSAVYKFKSDGTKDTYKGWFDNNTRYAKGDGTVANSVMKIGKNYYLFNENNGVKVTNKGFITQSGKTYYISSGVVTLGWKAIGKKAYFFYKSGSNVGAQAKNTTIGYLKIPAKGYLGEAYALGIKKLNKTKWTLKQAYRNSYKIRYQGRWWRQKTAEKYALKGFKKNKGNCYVMASTFYIQAKLLGYNVRQIEGKVNGRHPHSWTQIKQDGKWRVYDPNFRNETGRSGWKIYYGKKGTWRYNRYHVFQK